MQRRWAGAVPYLRISRAPAGQADVKARIIAAMGARALQGLASVAGVRVAPALSGIYNFEGDVPAYAQLMQHWLATTPHHGIIMCHPARGVAPNDPIGAARDREYHYLASPDFARALVGAGVMVARGACARQGFAVRCKWQASARQTWHRQPFPCHPRTTVPDSAQGTLGPSSRSLRWLQSGLDRPRHRACGHGRVCCGRVRHSVPRHWQPGLRAALHLSLRTKICDSWFLRTKMAISEANAPW